MRALRKVAVLAVASAMVLGSLSVVAQTPDDVPHGRRVWLPDHNWSGQFCRYPGPNLKRVAGTTSATLRATQVTEVEPNDLFANAQVLTLAPTPTDVVNVDVKGVINIGADVDLYRFTAKKGDIFGMAVVANGPLDSILAIQQINQVTLIENDDDGNQGFFYPASAPWPSGVGIWDSALTWVCPADSEYLIRVVSYALSSRGDYTLQIRARRPSFETQNTGTTQIIFLDFDGATIDAQQTFNLYFAISSANLSPLRAFLPRWGLTWQDEAEVTQAIIDNVNQTFDALRRSSLNGNLKTDNTLGHYDVQILNSRDHADPWGQPNVSRVIIGGTMSQLGIPTIGIASAIDPGNFSREDTAVVLLDLLSDPQGSTLSINSIGLASGKTIFDAIGQTVGTIVVHEAGHFLGNWHTDNSDEIPCIMDTGSSPIWVAVGVGVDAVLGSADDQIIEFVPDAFDPFEYVAVGDEPTQVNTAFSLSSGRVRRDEAPTIAPPTYPLASIRATPTSGSPPLTVQFTAGAIDDATDVSYIWDFVDGSPAASGPIISHVFQTPGEFLVKVTATNSRNATGQATVLVTVAAGLPTAVIVATPTRGAAPLTVRFDGSTSTTASTALTPVSYVWDFDDSTTATGAVVTHTYSAAGYYAAKLTFTDSAGGTSTASTLIAVNAPTSSSSLNAATTTPAASNPQCGLGGGVMMIGSCVGLLVMMSIRRRY